METIEPMSIALYGNLREPLVTYGQNEGSNWGLMTPCLSSKCSVRYWTRGLNLGKVALYQLSYFRNYLILQWNCLYWNWRINLLIQNLYQTLLNHLILLLYQNLHCLHLLKLIEQIFHCFSYNIFHQSD